MLVFFYLSVASLIFGSHFKVLYSDYYQNILEIPGISETDLQLWAAVLRDFIIPSRRTAGAYKIILEKR